ncbi:MAG: efflux RND transporter periplasmic adaptor subunit [Acidobacteriia bacterium]|nr:efflux RND transporter periplasmic adaptor subunit [Terriglobia bacterium]
MKRTVLQIVVLLISISFHLTLSGCSNAQGDPTKGAPPPAKIVPVAGPSLFAVDHPEQFPLATATEHTATSELVVTGTVAPDVSRAVPVTSLVSGRITGIYARLGDTVHKGQRLLTVRSDDISGGFSDYRKAARTEALTRIQLERAQDLYQHGAIALNDLQVAQQTEDNAKVDVETTAEKLEARGSDLNHPAGIVDIVSPVSGVITDQQVTNSGGLQSLSTAAFTISDLSSVWVICDVYENDLSNVHIGDAAEIRLNAYPDRVLKGRVSNIGATLDPNIRTAKVRMEVQNPGLMRLGMFVQATFRGQRKEVHTSVPATAILHIHDRDFVYVPAPDNKFRRVEVVSGDGLPGNMQEVRSGIAPGQQVVANALVLEHTIDQ